MVNSYKKVKLKFVKTFLDHKQLRKSLSSNTAGLKLIKGMRLPKKVYVGDMVQNIEVFLIYITTCSVLK